MHHWRTGFSVFAFVLVAAFATPRALAAEIDLGNHSKDEIKNACNAAGGELLGVSDSGSYGCEVASKGTMILCNKAGNCTGYTPARTTSQGQRILTVLKLKGRAIRRAATTTPTTPKREIAEGHTNK